MSFTQKTKEEHGENSIEESLVICTSQQNWPYDANKEEKSGACSTYKDFGEKKIANVNTRKN
jgi:hypothetical protein